MGLRDTWHTTLVYFGLAEDREPAYYDDEDDVEPAPRRAAPAAPERSSSRGSTAAPVARLSTRRRGSDFDDIFSDDDPREPRTTRLRAVGGGNGARSGSDVRVHLVIPKSFNDAQQVADRFKDSIPVVLNLQATDSDLAKRLIDFASGLTYALDGGMQRIADKVFMLTPRNVQISAEERAQLIEKGFFNQS
jgi:cell division inhibitor SepF